MLPHHELVIHELSNLLYSLLQILIITTTHLMVPHESYLHLKPKRLTHYAPLNPTPASLWQQNVCFLFTQFAVGHLNSVDFVETL